MLQLHFRLGFGALVTVTGVPLAGVMRRRLHCHGMLQGLGNLGQPTGRQHPFDAGQPEGSSVSEEHWQTQASVGACGPLMRVLCRC
jgi:hypothetical protein